MNKKLLGCLQTLGLSASAGLVVCLAVGSSFAQQPTTAQPNAQAPTHQYQPPPMPVSDGLANSVLAQPTRPPQFQLGAPAIAPSQGQTVPILQREPVPTGPATNPAVVNPAASTPMPIEIDPTYTTDLYAVLETSMGKIKLILYSTIVPRTVKNFVMLATGQKDFRDVKTGRTAARPFYNGLIFHKVVKGFVIQTGCPFGTGKGGPGYTIKDEFTPALRHNKPGMVSMANAGKDTNGSQFFITLKADPDLDDKYAVFAEVVEGMDVVRKISQVRVGPTDRPLHRIYLKSVTISQKKD